MNRRWLYSVLALAGSAGALYYLYRRLEASAEGIVTPEVGEKLPLAKNLETIPDQVGNYDIDGVSFDSEGVIIASDNLSPNQTNV